MIFEKVAAILADQFGIDEDDISLDSLLLDDLGADSLDVIEIIMSIEDEFSIEVPDSIIEKMVSVADIVNYIEKTA
ncbi:MAG: acyl carrier protein [Clostridiales bacterium]|nr:acyl carrier protein [Clostridiales bacterium]